MTAPVIDSPAVLLMAARRALGVTQQQLGELLGASKRTVMRWEGGRSQPAGGEWEIMAKAVFAIAPDVAARCAVHTGKTLEALGLAALPAAPRGAAASKPVEPRPYEVDSVVCAAAEAAGLAPQAVRPVLWAALERALAMGLGVQALLDGLRAATPPAPPA